MCGRFSQTNEQTDLFDLFELDTASVDLAPRYNIAPAYGPTPLPPPIIIRAVPADGTIEAVRARWWFIPSWWSKPLKELPTTFNARGAELLDKPFFREQLLRGQRCLVYLDSWYEFRGPRGKKEAYRFRQRDGGLLVWPGIWDDWTDRAAGQVVTSFTVLTTEPTELIRPYHDRMALNLHPDNYRLWLSPTLREPEQVVALMAPHDPGIDLYRVSGVVNSVHNEGPECWDEYEEPEPVQGSLF